MESITVALITGGMTLLGTIISVWSINSKTIYRIDQLEKKQDKHNSLIERMYECERKLSVDKVRLEEIEERLGNLEK